MSVYFVGLGLAHATLAVMVSRRRPRRDKALLVLVLVLCGLAYDNLSVGFGSLIGEGDLLLAINYPRFVLHALLTPGMVVVGTAIAARAGAERFQSFGLQRGFLVFAGLLVLVGIGQDVIGLQLVPESEAGTLRYVHDHVAAPPIAAILTVVALIVAGIATLRAKGGPALLLGAVVMFVAAGAGASIIWLANAGELALALGISLAALRWLTVSTTGIPGIETVEGPVADPYRSNKARTATA